MPTQSVMDRIYAGLLGPTTNYGGILDSTAEQQARQQAMMATGANLLGNSGWSSTPTSLSQAVGQAAGAGRAAQTQGLQDALQAQLLRSQITRNERGDLTAAVRDYQFAKQDGFAGSFEDWKKVTQQEAKGPASIQEYQLYTQQAESAGQEPMDFDSWIKHRAAMAVATPYTTEQRGGGRGAFDRRTGAYTPGSTLDEEAGAAGVTASTETGAKATA